jgi:hypothetical protein
MLQRINIFDINAVHPVIYVRVSILHVKNTSNSTPFHKEGRFEPIKLA